MPRRPRPDEIVDLLRRAIRERLLVPGEALNQDDLARRFGVSRIPLREALRTLVGEGLVVMQPGAGAVVTELHAAELGELFDLRSQLEPSLTAAVVGRVSPDQLDQLEGHVDRLEQIVGTDPEGWAAQHYSFHRRLLEMAGRRHSLRLLTQVTNLLEPYNRLYVTLVGPQEHSHSEHRQLLNAIRDGDRAAVERQVAQSIACARKRLESAVASTVEEKDPLASLLVDR